MHPSSILVPLSWFISPSDPTAGRRPTADVMCISLGHRWTAGGHQSLHKRQKWPWSASSMAGVVHQNLSKCRWFWTTHAVSMYLWSTRLYFRPQVSYIKMTARSRSKWHINVIGFWWVFCIHNAFLTLTLTLCWHYFGSHMLLQCTYGATRLYFRPQVSYIRMTASSRCKWRINLQEQTIEYFPI